MANITQEYFGADRYTYDFGLCSIKHGFAQIDTGQDASYYGQWCNPFRLLIFQYIEGDCITTECETAAEFCEEIRKIVQYHTQNDRFYGIDPGLNLELIEQFTKLGLADLLH
ncbi:MAG: hypothetical protein AVO38_10930 [delta proteobacterium ML8_D]|nr:MAG: hypothetical protein AVO34_05325 [Firmicutes bacterium ML8_F2]OPL15101.1 MAG: hypothetical protein AVO38_10930 [delta proteobacterium ML8_D]